MMSGFGPLMASFGRQQQQQNVGPYSAGEEISTLWVGNVPPNSVDAEMAASFGQFGQLVCAFVLKRLSPQGQLSGFAQFTSRAEAGMALNAVTAGQVIVGGAAVTAKWASKNSKPLGSPASSGMPQG